MNEKNANELVLGPSDCSRLGKLPKYLFIHRVFWETMSSKASRDKDSSSIISHKRLKHIVEKSPSVSTPGDELRRS